MGLVPGSGLRSPKYSVDAIPPERLWLQRPLEDDGEGVRGVSGLLGREQAGLSTSDRFQTGFRPVSDQCQTSVMPDALCHSPCHSVSSPMDSPCPHVMSDAQSCRMHRSVLSDAQCHFGYALVWT